MLFILTKPPLVCCEGYIYAIGGDSVGGELNRRTVERYDTEKDEWTMVSPLPCAWQWSAAVVVHDCIYVMTLNLRYCYFLRSDSWVEMAWGRLADLLLQLQLLAIKFSLLVVAYCYQF